MQSRKKFFTKQTLNPNRENVYLFENDKSDFAVSVSEFLIVDLDHDEDEDIDIM